MTAVNKGRLNHILAEGENLIPPVMKRFLHCYV